MTSEKQTLEHIVELMEDILEKHKNGIELLSWPYNAFVEVHQWAKDELDGKIDASPTIIVVEGGVVQEVINLDDGYYLLDWDNLRGGDTITRKLAEIYVENDVCTMHDIERYIGEDD